MLTPGFIVAVVEAFRPEFTAATWAKVLVLLWGTILARGRRTVTAALRQAGIEGELDFSKFHHVFNRASWSPLRLACRLTGLLVRTFGPADPRLTFVIDETLERRWGKRIRLRGHYRDPLASSKERSVAASGIRWIVLALIVTPPWSTAPWAVPVLSLPSPTPRVSARLGRRHKTIADQARRIILRLRRWLPEATLTVVDDQADSVIELGLLCRRHDVQLIAPGRPPVRSGSIAAGRDRRPPSQGRRPVARARCGPERPEHRLGGRDAALVRGHSTGPGGRHGDRLVVSPRLPAVADPLGPQPRSSRRVATAGVLLDPRAGHGRRDPGRGRWPLADRDDLRGSSGPPGHRDATAMVRLGGGAGDSMLVRPVFGGDAARACAPSGPTVADPHGVLVSEDAGHLLRCVGSRWPSGLERDGYSEISPRPVLERNPQGPVRSAAECGLLAGQATQSIAGSSISGITPTTLKDGRSIDVGFGSGLGKPRGHRLIEANGGRPGTATNLVRSVDDRITISLLMNSRAEMERISRGVARHFIPSLNLVKPMTGQVDVARLAAFLGAGLAIAAKTLFYDVRGSLVLPTCPVDQFASPIGHADPPLGGRPALQAVPDDRPGFRLIGGYMPDKRAAGAGRHGGLNREHLLSQLSFRGCRQRAD